MTNYLDFTYTSVPNLCGISKYFDTHRSNITDLDFHFGKINIICDKTLAAILKHPHMKSLNLAQNSIHQIPTLFNRTTGSLEKLWLGGNPVQCGCHMLWLIPWLNRTRVFGQRLVQDYQDVICTGGKLDGIPVYTLNSFKMLCSPRKVAARIIVLSSVISGFLLLSVIAMIIINRKWNAVRWIVYKNFDKLLGDPDRNEDLKNVEFDAFLSFW